MHFDKIVKNSKNDELLNNHIKQIEGAFGIDDRFELTI